MITLTTIPGKSHVYTKEGGGAILSLSLDPRSAHIAKDIKSLAGKPLRITVEEDKPKRSSGANRLFHSVCRQIAADIYRKEIASGELTESDALDLVKDGVKHLAVSWGYPEVFNKTRRCKEPASSRNRTPKEFAVLMEASFAEAAANAVDIREDVIQWDHYAAKHAVSLDDTYPNETSYRERHPFCEACLRWLGEGGELAHIRSRGALGVHDPSNWLMLCVDCHRKTQHQHGWGKLIMLYPRIKEKVNAALRNQRPPEWVCQPVSGHEGSG